MLKSPIASWTDAKYKNWIISLLRRGTMRWPPRNEVLREAKTEKKTNVNTGRIAQHYKCSGCSKDFPAKEVRIDHIHPIVDVRKGFETWDIYIGNMYCGKDKLQVLCLSCHKDKSENERQLRKDYRDATKERQTKGTSNT